MRAISRTPAAREREGPSLVAPNSGSLVPSAVEIPRDRRGHARHCCQGESNCFHPDRDIRVIPSPKCARLLEQK
jgi:hypothetical protein